jgi:peptide/nickel transport system ATP-binding protein
MYAGRIVEERAAEEIFRNPSHPYTSGLVASLPLLGARAKHGRQRLKEIAGVVPPVAGFPNGCRFNPRCGAATDICRVDDPSVTPLPGGGFVRCHHHG